MPKHNEDAAHAIRIGDLEIRSHWIDGTAGGGRTSLYVGQGAGLVLVTAAQVEFTQSGRQVLLREGQWFLAYGELLAAAEGQARVVVVQLGADFFLRGAEQLRPHMLVRHGERGAGRMVYAHAAGLIGLEQGISMGAGQELAAITAHLVRLALVDASSARPLVSMRETLRLRIRAFIERNLHDPDLTIDTIAARFNCSKRNLHKVFQEEGDTINRFLWSARLERCRRDLTDPILRHRSITDIAFSWGFNSSAHFSRAFRSRFGFTPRDLRN